MKKLKLSKIQKTNLGNSIQECSILEQQLKGITREFEAAKMRHKSTMEMIYDAHQIDPADVDPTFKVQILNEKDETFIAFQELPAKK